MWRIAVRLIGGAGGLFRHYGDPQGSGSGCDAGLSIFVRRNQSCSADKREGTLLTPSIVRDAIRFKVVGMYTAGSIHGMVLWSLREDQTRDLAGRLVKGGGVAVRDMKVGSRR